MATFQNALVCAALALVMWGSIGYAIGSRLLPRSLTLPFAPLLGWAVHSTVALPLFYAVGMTRATLVATTLLPVIASLYDLLYHHRKGDAARSGCVGVPLLAVFSAGLLACAIMCAIIPTVTSGGAALAPPVFDHAKVAMIDDMARLGVPAGNPFLGESGGHSRLAYYYLWHFSAAEISALTQFSGWEADAGMTCFTAMSSLMLMMGLAVSLSSRASSAFWGLAIAATSSIREILSWVFGWKIVGTLTGWPTGFGGWLFQVVWAPQHVASAGCAIIALLLLVWMARRPSWPLALTMSLVAAAAFESSTWVGGVTFPLAAIAIGTIELLRAEAVRRRQFITHAVVAAAVAVLLSSQFIHDQLLASMARGGGTPISLLPYTVLGDEIPEKVRAILDLPAYWTVFLFVELAAFYPSGLFFAVWFLKEGPASTMRRELVLPLVVLTVVSLGVGGVLVSNVAVNNDLAWRGVLPATIALIAFTAAGFGRYLRVMRPLCAVTALAILALGVLSGGQSIYEFFRVRPPALAKRFLDSTQMWAAVRDHSASGDRVANNPTFLADVTPWPINISWALLANRRSCYAGPDFALPFASVTSERRMEIDKQFTDLFAGRVSREDVDRIATQFDCALMVVTPEDGAWSTGLFASTSIYPLIDSAPGAWRIYDIRTKLAR